MHNIFSLRALYNTNAVTTTSNPSQVPGREEIDATAKWNLNDIYPTEAAFHNDIGQVKEMLAKLTRYKDRLEFPENLKDCLALRDALGCKVSALFAYARMSRDTDAKNQAYQAVTAQMEALLAEVAGACAFIEPELLALPTANLLAQIKATPELRTYQFYMEDLLRQKQHVLSPLEEELLAKAGELMQLPSNIYTIFTSADLKFPETLSESGAKIQLSEGRYNALIRSTHQKVRQAAFESLFQTYAGFRNTFATTFAGNVKNTIFHARAKKYKSTLSAALDSHSVPTAVYTNVIAEVHRNLPCLHSYIALKQKLLQLDQIHMYDLYVPLAKEPRAAYAYQDALKLVTESLQPLGSQYLTDLEQGIDGGWIDIYENQGKRTGAYSWGVFGVHPFVLLNYDGRYGAVSTLAHELGHAMHSYYSNANQDYINASYTIFCAEVASTTNEILLLDHMLETETDPTKRIYFINQYLEQVRTTVYRQTMFAEFEWITHAKAEAGETLTADLLEQIWLDLNRKYYGEAIILDDAIKIEWARIPHFYRPFYVYQYVTGYAAGTALAQQLRTEGRSAQLRYQNYLQSGGSAYSIELLKTAGVDMTTAAPLAITLEKFAKRLKELENFLAIT